MMKKLGRPKTSIDVPCKCATCGKEYTVPEHQVNGRKYCSRKCFFEGSTGKPKPARRVVREERKCKVCENTFLVGGRALENGQRDARTVFCSRKCTIIGTTKASPPRTMSEGEAMWLAGLFDGEGSVTFPKSDRSNYRISICNTNEALLQRIVAVTGTGSLIVQPNRQAHHSPAWNWQCYGHTAEPILRQMLPWLIVKRDRAEVALGIREMTEELRYVRKRKLE